MKELELLKAGGIFKITHIRNGEVISVDHNHNLVTFEGLEELMGRAFSNNPQTPFYMALYTGNHTPDQSDTAASLPSTAIEYTAYNETTRPQFNCVLSSFTASNTANKATFTFAANATIYGIWTTTSQAKGSTGGKSLSINKLLVPKQVTAGDQITVEYIFDMASST